MGKAPGSQKHSASQPVRSRKARLPAALLQQSLVAASSALVITDCQQKGNPVVFANPAFENLTGYNAGEVLGESCRFLLGKDQGQESPEKIRKALKGEQPCTTVLRTCRKDGSLFQSELSIAPLRDSAGKATHFLWAQRDVTEQKKKEEGMAALIAEKERRFAAYVGNVNEAIWCIDFEPPIPLDDPESRQVQAIFDNGVFAEANDAVAHIYGLTEGREVIGRPLKEFLEQANPGNVERMVELVRHKFRMNNLLTHEKDANGTASAIVNNISPEIQNGQVRYVWGASIDLSEFFEAQEDLEGSRKKLAVQKKALEEKNLALKEVITHIEMDKKDLKDRIMANVSQVVIPALDKIRLNNGADGHVEQLRRALEDLTSSFGLKVADITTKLTPRETEVCSMVKNGLASKEIARLLNIAPHTVEKHRRMARNKLGLANKGINLHTYLNSLE